MDDRLRKLERRFRETNTIEDERAYLQALRQSSQIDDARLERAAFFGSQAANEIVPYDTPYALARIMWSDPPPEPETSWFCDGIYRDDDLHDIADIWCQIDMIGGSHSEFFDRGYLNTLVVVMLLLYAITTEGLREEQQEGQPGVWWGPTAIGYNRLRHALITQTPDPTLPENAVAPQQAMRLLGILVNQLLGLEYEDEAIDVIMDLRWLIGEFLQTIRTKDRKRICDFVSKRMRDYQLGYADLSQTLPLI